MKKNKSSLKRRISLIYVSLIFIIIVLGAISIYSLNNISRSVSSLITTNYNSIERISKMDAALKEQRQDMLLYIYSADEEDSIKAVSDNEYIVDGNTKLDDINEIIELGIEAEDYDSIAGHVICLLDHLPDEGETVTDGNITYTVLAVDKNRIDKIHILINPVEEDEEVEEE